MGWFRKKRKERRPRVLFDGLVKRMDVRYGSFIWLQVAGTEEEFVGDLSIHRVVVDLPSGMLSRKVEAKTEDGHVKLKLKYILDNLGDRHRYFKFVQFKRPVHIRIKGVRGGDAEIFIGEAEGGKENGLREETEEEDGPGCEEGGEEDRVQGQGPGEEGGEEGRE